jgi:hypothetical protein
MEKETRFNEFLCDEFVKHFYNYEEVKKEFFKNNKNENIADENIQKFHKTEITKEDKKKFNEGLKKYYDKIKK